MKRDKPQRSKLPQFLYSCSFALLFTLSHISHFFQFHTKLVPLPFQLFSASTLFSPCDYASTFFFFLLFLVLSVLKSSDQSSSFSTYMLHTPLLCFLTSLFWWSLKLIKLVLLATIGWPFYILVQDNELYSQYSD